MNETKICVIGLGYVGLPLARLFSTKYKTIGFDMNQARVTALMAGHDATLEVSDELLQSALANGFKCTANIEEIRDYNFYVVAVPTPVDKNNNPDLTPLYGASTTVGKVISKGDIVVYESTVYPGVTEDECIPVVEKVSGLKFNEDFFAGYSPERINPGDKLHTVEKIKKVTSGSTPEIGKKVNEVYASVITAGTHLAPTMKVAEAAKVIENSQRDINIAFVNELSKIFTKMGIDTQDVLEAASTKWNFLPFKPGLVGGHCIGVDPYYLAQCAQRHGYNPEIILAGRRMNDGMGEYVANQVAKLMLKKGIQVLNSHILILGFTFKENCPDVRNTKVIDIYNALREYNVHITVYDPWANPDIVMREYGISVTNQHPLDKKFDAAIIAVAHEQFIGFDVKTLLNAQHVIFDVKASTVFTPVYNRKNLIGNLYQSLLSQTYKNFEWIIVDDGSTDDIDEIIKSYQNEDRILIRFIKQENGGKHRAINNGVLHAKGELFYIVDSDDYLTKDSIERIVFHYQYIKNNDKFAGVCGMKCFPDGSRIGKEVTWKILKDSWINYWIIKNIKGDVAFVFKTSVLRNYLFDDIPGEKFCAESLVLNRIGKNYLMLFFNEKIYIAEYLSDGLSVSSIKNRMNSPNYAMRIYSEMASLDIPYLKKIKAHINYWRFAPCSKLKMKNKIKQIGISSYIIFMPIGYLFHMKDKKNNYIDIRHVGSKR